MARQPKGATNPGPGLFDDPPRQAHQKDPEVTPARSASASQAAEPQPFTVTQLTNEIAGRLGGIGRVRVEGELSGLKRHTSGHLYFDLKDDRARISCVVWKGTVRRALRFVPEDGMQVMARGKLNVYEPRGIYNLIVEALEPLGTGALLAQLEQLKVDLRARGWFDRRRPLPRMPRCIGLVTSRDGAALRDFLRTRSLRWRGYPVRLCHAPVQGPGSALELAEAIRCLDASGVDLIVVSRGGGSLEDLWSFNERAVAEAIWHTRVPVVTGVGHESDTTLADLVADHRAHTPTDAAQSVIPDRRTLTDGLERLQGYLTQGIGQALERRSETLLGLARRRVLTQAGWILGERVERLRHVRQRLMGALERRMQTAQSALSELHRRVEARSPAASLGRLRERFGRLGERLLPHGRRRLEHADAQLALQARALESISPLKVLGRGYSITRRGRVALTSASQVKPGDELETRLAHGRVISEVRSSEPAD